VRLYVASVSPANCCDVRWWPGRKCNVYEHTSTLEGTICSTAPNTLNDICVVLPLPRVHRVLQPHFRHLVLDNAHTHNARFNAIDRLVMHSNKGVCNCVYVSFIVTEMKEHPGECYCTVQCHVRTV